MCNHRREVKIDQSIEICCFKQNNAALQRLTVVNLQGLVIGMAQRSIYGLTELAHGVTLAASFMNMIELEIIGSDQISQTQLSN
jgi:hypothetical protein